MNILIISNITELKVNEFVAGEAVLIRLNISINFLIKLPVTHYWSRSKLQIINQPSLPQLRRTQHDQGVAALAAHGEAALWGLQICTTADG